MSTEDGASEPTFVEEGREFKRDTNYIPTRITEDGASIEAGTVVP